MPTDQQNHFMVQVLGIDQGKLPQPAYPTADPAAHARQQAALKAERAARAEHSRHAPLVQTAAGGWTQQADTTGLRVPEPPAPPPPPSAPSAPAAAQQAASPPARPAYDPEKAAAHLAQSRADAEAKARAIDAELDKLQAEVQALEAQHSGIKHGGLPSFADLINNAGPALDSMRLLDKAKTYEWVIFDGKQTDTKTVMAQYGTEAARMADTMDKLVGHSQRDLKKMLAGPGSNGGGKAGEIAARVAAILPKAAQAAGAARDCFRQHPPEFEKGMHLLVGSMRLNQAAGDLVEEWSRGVIDDAENAINVIRTGRDVLIGAATAVFIAANAPMIAVGAAAVGVSSLMKAGIKAGDALQEGKEVPWGEITFGLLLDLVTGIIGAAAGTLAQPAGDAFAASAFGKQLVQRGVSPARLAKEMAELLKEVYALGTEPVKSIAEDLWKGRPKDAKAVTTRERIRELIAARCSDKAIVTLLVGRLTDRLSGPAGERLKGAH